MTSVDSEEPASKKKKIDMADNKTPVSALYELASKVKFVVFFNPRKK